MKVFPFLVAVFLLNCSLSYAQVSVTPDGTPPDNSAMLEVKSNNKGFLPPRLSSEQINTMPDPADGLVVYNISDKHLYVFNSSSGLWQKLALASEGTWNCGDSITIQHLAGNLSPVSKLVTYGTVLSYLTDSPKCWITQNLGAAHPASSGTDATEASAGWYWQFNRLQGYMHDGTTRTPDTAAWITMINEHSDWLADNDPCYQTFGPGWRLPTDLEWDAALTNGGWSDLTTAYTGELALHAAGYLDYTDGSLQSRGATGIYWSQSNFENNSGYLLFFNSLMCILSTDSKSFALPIRCIKNL